MSRHGCGNYRESYSASAILSRSRLIHLVELDEYLVKLIGRYVWSLVIYKHSEVSCDLSVVNLSWRIIVRLCGPDLDLAAIIAVMKRICEVICKYLLYHKFIGIHIALFVQRFWQLNISMILLYQNR